jgi:phage terminase large subunit-like protein
VTVPTIEVLKALEATGELRRALETLSDEQKRVLKEHWPTWAHCGQRAPEGPWASWVLLAGRGFGKTRAGAEWVSQFARDNPGAAIALVAATVAEARSVMIEGRSGLLAVARFEERGAMRWEPTRRRLVFASGAEAFLYSGASPDSLRGPEHHIAWCDEMAKWKKAAAAWANLRLGLRLGDPSTGSGPRALVTTTPKAVPGLKALLARADTALSGGATWANPHLPDSAVAGFVDEHHGTRFGRQELEGLLIEDVEGALWPRELIERSRVEDSHFSLRGAGGGDSHFSLGGAGRRASARESDCPHTRESDRPLSPFRRVVVAIDPPASAEGDACGIVVAGLGKDGIAYVLADMSASGLSPDGWARRSAQAAAAWGAHRVVAEKNNGGAMVEAVLRNADPGLPVTLVHASDGKVARAEPVAALFERGKAKLAGRFPELEDQLAGLTYGGGYEGPGSPDRADAMVWALTELMVKRQRAEPRVRGL